MTVFAHFQISRTGRGFDRVAQISADMGVAFSGRESLLVAGSGTVPAGGIGDGQSRAELGNSRLEGWFENGLDRGPEADPGETGGSISLSYVSYGETT